MKRVIAIFLLAFVLAKWSQQQTDGFTWSKTPSLFLEEGPCDLDPSLFSQSYAYYGKGGQSYIFLSEDGKIILKIPRSSKWQTLKALSCITPFFEKKLSAEKKRLCRALKSHALAYQHLREETGLIGVQLAGKVPFAATLKIVDKLGIVHTIDSSRFPLLFQRRVDLVQEKIEQCMTSQNLPKAEHALLNLFALIQSIEEKGIVDADANLSKNFGFFRDQPLLIDTGSLSNSGTRSDKLSHSKEDLQHWINKHHPELSKRFDELYHEVF